MIRWTQWLKWKMFHLCFPESRHPRRICPWCADLMSYTMDMSKGNEGYICWECFCCGCRTPKSKDYHMAKMAATDVYYDAHQKGVFQKRVWRE